VIYTYVLLYQLQLNTLEEQLFDKCVDSMIAENPDGYCKQSIIPALSNMRLWKEDTKQQACKEGGDSMLSTCGEQGSVCHPCAEVIAYVFAKYEKQVEMTVETIFEEISEEIAKVLSAAKDKAKSSNT
jgi:hypothetical protein